MWHPTLPAQKLGVAQWLIKDRNRRKQECCSSASPSLSPFYSVHEPQLEGNQIVAWYIWRLLLSTVVVGHLHLVHDSKQLEPHFVVYLNIYVLKLLYYCSYKRSVVGATQWKIVVEETTLFQSHWFYNKLQKKPSHCQHIIIDRSNSVTLSLQRQKSIMVKQSSRNMHLC